jgi:hypothetical protein
MTRAVGAIILFFHHFHEFWIPYQCLCFADPFFRPEGILLSRTHTHAATFFFLTVMGACVLLIGAWGV